MKLSTTIKLIFSGVIIAVSSAAFALPDITGNWKCTGYDPVQKKNMSVSGEIKKSGDTYSLVNWKDEGSDEEKSGIAIHNDKMKNSLAVLFWSNEDQEHVGIVLSEVKSKDKIVGMWAMKSGKATAKEVCERIKA